MGRELSPLSTEQINPRQNLPNLVSFRSAELCQNIAPARLVGQGFCKMREPFLAKFAVNRTTDFFVSAAETAS